MKLRLFIIILFSLPVLLLKAQETPTRIRVLQSDYVVGVRDEAGSRSWIINGTFQHENATMRCDSAFLNNEKNTLEAYGDVFIRQADTITVQSDRLFYDGNTRLARLYDNITMSDGQAVLTTNFMTYDMNTREGTYYDGGQIVNKEDTLTSVRGYYFVNSKDAYFRQKAVVTTPDAVIRSDTLRYNTGTRVAYFYGPTTIQGSDDFIYAENGTYNTDTDQADFQENAYYQSGNQLLKGNELYYDRQRNFGRASGNVFIIDTVEHIILRGELGEYNKATETAFVTDSARVLMIAEQDSARTDTIFMAADTLKTRLLPQVTVEEWIKTSHERDVLGREIAVTSLEAVPSAGQGRPGGAAPSTGPAGIIPGSLPVDSLLPGSFPPDSLLSDSLLREAGNALLTDSMSVGGLADSLAALAGGSAFPAGVSPSCTIPPSAVPAADGNPVPAFEADPFPAAGAPDEGHLTRSGGNTRRDSLPDNFIGPPPLALTDYLPPEKADSVAQALAAMENGIPADTTELTSQDSVRVLFAYHRVRIFKSDFQAIADSLVYTELDSVMRCYKDPVLWSEGSQMNAEFMTISLRDQKLDKMNMYRSAMIISEVAGDTVRYNQMSGKNMVGDFVEGALDQLLVEGNARTIYYVPEDSLHLLGINYAENSRTILHFSDNKLKMVELLKDVDQTTYPPFDPEAVTRLDGFHWRAEERPRDKDDIFRKVDPTPPPPASGTGGSRPLQSSLLPVGARRDTVDAAQEKQPVQDSPGAEATDSGTSDPEAPDPAIPDSDVPAPEVRDPDIPGSPETSDMPASAGGPEKNPSPGGENPAPDEENPAPGGENGR